MISRYLFPALASAMLGGCNATIPEIARGLPSKYAEGEAVFDARLKARFPPGTSEEALLAELGRQGFPMPPVRDSSGYAYSEFTRGVFKTIWSVRWRADRGRIAEIWGVHGVRAP